MNTTGYLNNSPHRFNNKNVIPGNIITMDNVDIPLLLRPNKGKSIIAMPNSGKYNFPKASYVTEIPLNSYQSGGSYFDKTGYHYKNLLNNFQQNNNNNFTDCPEGYVKDETGQCVLDNGFNPSQYQNKGMPIIPKLNINNQSVGGVGAISTNQNNISNQNQSQDMKLKRIFGTPNIPAILATNLLGFGLASFANNVEQGRQKAAMQQQMNNPLFNGSYSFAQNDYGVDPYEQTGQLRPTFQKGGRMPIIVTNPNDSRLKAYNDSMTLYNVSQTILPKYNNRKYIKENGKYWTDETAWASEKGAGAYKRLKNPEPIQELRKNLMWQVGNEADNKNTIGVNLFKKPVQPVVYQKKPIFKRPEPNPITPIEFNPSNVSSVIPLPNMQRAEWDASKPTPFVFTNATGNYLEGKNTYFPDEQSLRKFAENQKNVSIQSSDSGATATGYLKSMLKGGIHINPENKGKFNATKARTGQLRPTFQKGGRMPIIVTNPNDSRLKAYNDSLQAYNHFQTLYNQGINTGFINDGRGKNVPVFSVANRQYITKQQYIDDDYKKLKSLGVDITKKDIQDAWDRVDTYKYSKAKNAYKFKHKNDEGDYTLLEYKKPVQPVVYQKPQQNNSEYIWRNMTPEERKEHGVISSTAKIRVKKPVGTPQPQKPIFKRPEPNPITPIEFNPSNVSSIVPLPNMQRAEWDASKPTPFVFTNATGNYLEGKNTYFPDEQSLRKFAENQKNVSIQSSDSGATATGYLKSMLKGGIHINPENKGKFNATKARTGKTTEELTHSKNPLTRKRAIFAQNAAKWKHQYGGQFDPIDYLYGNEEEQKADTIEAPIKQVKQKRITEEDVDSMNNQMAFDILNMDSLSTAKKYPIQNNSEYLSMYLKHQQGEAGYNAIAKAASQGLEYVPRNWNKENIQFNMQRNVGKDFKGKLTPASFINYWNDKFNRHMQIAANKQTPYDSIFNKVGEEEGINPLFLKTVANIESGLNPNNNTAFKYKGLFAMNSKTFKGNIFDPYQNSKVAAQNFKRFEQGGVFDVDFDMLVKLQEKGIKFKIIE